MMRGLHLEQSFQDSAQSETSMLPGGSVYQVGERWHAEIGGGWWFFVAGTREAAIKGVTRIYQQEVGKVEI